MSYDFLNEFDNGLIYVSMHLLFDRVRTMRMVGTLGATRIACRMQAGFPTQVTVSHPSSFDELSTFVSCHYENRRRPIPHWHPWENL